jgi:hypothetical protein
MLCDTGGANIVTPEIAKELGLETQGALQGRGLGEKSEDVALATVDTLQSRRRDPQRPGFCRLPAGFVLEGRGCQLRRLSRGSPEAVVAHVGRDAVEPRGHGRRIAQRPELPVGAQEGLLGQVLGLGLVAHHPAEVAPDAIAVLLVEPSRIERVPGLRAHGR